MRKEIEILGCSVGPDQAGRPSKRSMFLSCAHILLTLAPLLLLLTLLLSILLASRQYVCSSGWPTSTAVVDGRLKGMSSLSTVTSLPCPSPNRTAQQRSVSPRTQKPPIGSSCSSSRRPGRPSAQPRSKPSPTASKNSSTPAPVLSSLLARTT